MAIGSGERHVGFLTPKQLFWKLTDAARQFRQAHSLTPDAALGRRGEDLAHRYLQSAGFKIVARNYRPGGGGDSEIDIIARDGLVTVFVEVKARSTDAFGAPDRAIGSDKQARIVKAARRYATRAGVAWSQVRFDTVAIVFSSPPSIVHQQDAFFGGRTM